jgi:hypothetical protein
MIMSIVMMSKLDHTTTQITILEQIVLFYPQKNTIHSSQNELKPFKYNVFVLNILCTFLPIVINSFVVILPLLWLLISWFAFLAID